MPEENVETTGETAAETAAVDEAEAPEEAGTTGVAVDDSPDPAPEETGTEIERAEAEGIEEPAAVIPLEDIQPAVIEADNRTPAEKDLAVLIAAQKIMRDPVRFMAAKAVPGAPFIG